MAAPADTDSVTAPRSADARATAATVRERTGRWTLFVAAALSVEAAWVHLWLVPETFFDWWGFGVFFLAVGLAQAGLAVALVVRPHALVLVGGVAGNLVVVTTYVLSRTTYLPVGPHAGSPETVGLLGTATTIAELGVIVALVALLPDTARRWVVNVVLVWGAALWALRLSELWL